MKMLRKNDSFMNSLQTIRKSNFLILEKREIAVEISKLLSYDTWVQTISLHVLLAIQPHLQPGSLAWKGSNVGK